MSAKLSHVFVRIPRFNMTDLKAAGEAGVYVRHLGQNDELSLVGTRAGIAEFLISMDGHVEFGAGDAISNIKEIE